MIMWLLALQQLKSNLLNCLLCATAPATKSTAQNATESCPPQKFLAGPRLGLHDNDKVGGESGVENGD
jgi:hypothetical protein